MHIDFTPEQQALRTRIRDYYRELFTPELRAAFDAISPIEVILAMLITIAGIWVLFTVGARVYAGAVLQTAGRMKIRDAWRSAGE